MEPRTTMNVHDYVTGAVATESKLDEIVANLPVSAVLHFGVAAGELVDMMKKHVFYKRPLDVQKWNGWIDQLEYWVKILKHPTDHAFAPIKFETDTRLFHAAVGIFTEGGELLEALTKATKKGGEDIDRINFREEIGDVEWYQAIAYDALVVNPEANFWNNHLKLNKDRYKDGFSIEAANNRNLEAERKTLETI
jgi:hypothetical protein